MLIIKVEKGNIEAALKKLKRKTINTKQNKELRERKEYIKPSVAKRKMKLKAKYKQSKEI